MKLVVVSLLIAIGGCTDAIAPENKVPGTSTLKEGDLNAATADGGAPTGATPDGITGVDGPAGGAEGADESLPAAPTFGTIVSKAGSLATKGFDPKNVYAQIMDFGPVKAFMVTITEGAVAANIKQVREYECRPCLNGDCNQPAGPVIKYESLMLKIQNPYAPAPGAAPNTDANGYPTNATGYEITSPGEQFVTAVYSDGDFAALKTFVGGDAAGVKVLSFDSLPTAASKKFKLKVKAKFIEAVPGVVKTDFTSSVDDVDVVVEGDVYAMPTAVPPPTCDDTEYAAPIYVD